jgi:hypothetical protein
MQPPPQACSVDKELLDEFEMVVVSLLSLVTLVMSSALVVMLLMILVIRCVCASATRRMDFWMSHCEAQVRFFLVFHATWRVAVQFLLEFFVLGDMMSGV